MEHYSVLLKECIEGLDIKPDGIYVDGTLGRGGHSLEIVKRLDKGRLIAFDLDQEAIAKSRIVLKDYLDKVTFIHDNFAAFKQHLEQMGIHHIDGILLDLGVSSPQFDDGERGFSYQQDYPLDMRMDQTQSLTAETVVNTYSKEQLQTIFKAYGEERNAARIAGLIVKQRAQKPIVTTFELVDIIRAGYPPKVLRQKGHPAKQVFQALRIEVNNELDSVRTAVNDAIAALAVNGRCVIISFHSLEDRIVKNAYREVTQPEKGNRRIPVIEKQINYEVINKKVIVAGEQENSENHRSQSAKLRILKRVR